MPFDSSTSPEITNRLRLIEALRGEMPHYKWDFRYIHYQSPCGSAGCAIGLAYEIGLISKSAIDSLTSFDALRKALGLEDMTIFSSCRIHMIKHYHTEEITPQMVADALEATLSEPSQ